MTFTTVCRNKQANPALHHLVADRQNCQRRIVLVKTVKKSKSPELFDLMKGLLMRKFFTLILILFAGPSQTQTIPSDNVLEPWTYSQDFETGELSAWASYPIWQDAAFDEKIRVNKIVPGDENLSLEQKVIPYAHVDNYAGAQKLLDMYLIPGSMISLKFYLKTQLNVESFKIRLAAGENGKVDYTIKAPPTNRWEGVKLTYDDFIRQNPNLAGQNIKVNDLAVLTKFPKADPAMPIYLGLDDIVFKGARTKHFKFNEPDMYKLPEWKPYIPKKQYAKDEIFNLSGYWGLDADQVKLEISPFTERSKKIVEKKLQKDKNKWFTKGIKLSFKAGLYLATLTAYQGKNKLADMEFTIYIAPENIGNQHPRLWFDQKKEEKIIARLHSEKFKSVKEHILSAAEKSREELPVENVIFDIDQFNDEIWLPTISAYFNRLKSWGGGVFKNALAYKLLKDAEAGKYAKELLVKVCKFPGWLHPWMAKRRRHIYYPVGIMAMDFAIGYDLCYDLFNENERTIIRQAFIENVIDAAHKGYVEDNLVTCNLSNWIAHIMGGSLMCQAVLYGEGENSGIMEPYFTGAILKNYALIQNAIGDDGGYGEGYGYYNFSMLSWSKSLPAVKNVFGVDLSAKINRSYEELIWAGVVKDKKTFYFGDSGGDLRPLTNWAWLLPKYKDPLLGWFYNFMKNGETFMDVLYETEDVPKQYPFNKNPDRIFEDIGTTVFKSGWDRDDFVFVMRTGPFINHQHLDQGTFWLYDNGAAFIEERHGSNYYRQLLYQSRYIQPIAHSTILIDKNPQSQRTGDPFDFAKGFEDYAYHTHYLDGKNAAFSSGELGRLYWNKVKQITRNVLYIKPKTILMLDQITPAERDVDVSLLYQTHYLKDINAGDEFSTITKENNRLFIYHIAPERLNVSAEDMPHFYNTALNEKPLIREGYLNVTGRTTGNPLLIANLLTSTTGKKPEIDVTKYEDYYKCIVNGKSAAFAKRQNEFYNVDGIETDALALTWDAENLFAAKCTKIKKDDKIIIESNIPISCEFMDDLMNYSLCKEAKVKIGTEKKPAEIILNDRRINFSYNQKNRTVSVHLFAGDGKVKIKY